MTADVVERLAEVLVHLLAPAGWSRCVLGRAHRSTDFCHPLGEGLTLVLRVLVAPMLGADRPPRASVTVGVGSLAAMDLAPVLGLPVTAAVVFRLDPDGPPQPPPVVVGHVDKAARLIADRAAAALLATGPRFPDPTALDAAVRSVPAAADSRAVQLALLAAATGRLDEANLLLLDASSGIHQCSDHARRAAARVQRQLGRWNEAGRPPPPPFEETLRRLPPAPSPPQFRWADVRDTARRRRQARAAVARRAAGRSVGELAAMLLQENERRGVVASPAVLFSEATQLHQRAGVVGRVLAAVRVSRAVVTELRGVGHDVRDPNPPPEWRRLPETAASQARAGGGHTLVDLNGDGEKLLSPRLSDETPLLRVGVWLDLDSDANTVVHVGDTVVGRLDREAASRLRPDVIAAADLYDEQIAANGLLFLAADGVPRLQLPLPPA